MNIRLSLLTIIFVSIFAVSIHPVGVGAQGISGAIDTVNLVSSVNSPNPGETITITAKSYSIDIDAANITWTAGGKTIAKGIGLTNIDVKAPSLGKTLTVNISAVAADGSVNTNQISITSASVDVIIEPEGYTPPGFQGRIPLAYQNRVKITAVPHLANSSGVEYEPSTLTYKWEQGLTVLEAKNGYGKQSVVIDGNIIPRPAMVRVTVSTRDGSAQGVGTVMVTPSAPFLVFYKNDPLYGSLYNNAVGQTMLLGTQRESGIVAAPYGFNIPAGGIGNVVLSWLINGVEHPELATNRTVTLRAPEDSAGASNVELTVTDKNNMLQQGNAGFKAIFSAPK